MEREGTKEGEGEERRRKERKNNEAVIKKEKMGRGGEGKRGGNKQGRSCSTDGAKDGRGGKKMGEKI